MVPVRRLLHHPAQGLPELLGVARPAWTGAAAAWPRASRSAGRAGPAWPRRTAPASCRSSMWCRSGGSSTVLGKCRSSLFRSPCAPAAAQRDRHPQVAPAGRPPWPPAARWPARAAAARPSASTCLMTRVPSPSSSSRRAAQQPVRVAGVGRVQDVEPPGRVAPLVHRPDHGQLADPGLALQRQPLAGGVDRLDLPAAAQPQRTGADQAGQGHRGLAALSAAGRLAGSISFTCTTPPATPVVAAHRPAVHPGLDAAGQLAPTPGTDWRVASASAAWPSSTPWSPGSSTCRA